MNEAVPRRPALGIGPDGTYTRTGQVFAFVLGLLTTFVFLPLVVVAALLYTNAENRFATNDVQGGRRLVIWSWLSITVLPLLVAGAIAVVVAAIRAATG
ncbi:hypothetical protein [Actinomadura fibrosa]|uniref:DUF4190 domain-containing protein n=1 Tax=Actinomadura fibrosa TaxID=111802 RepID=A0ABW2XMG0_9ACTN|nr:hypothetical protein [Actinomadura fibrosa]